MNRKRIIFSSICVILLIALVGGTLAWFYINEEVTVSYGNSIFCEAGDSLEIALVEEGKENRWTSSIDYSAGEFTTVDISGNGVNLYRPAEIDENRQPLNMKPAVSTMAGEKSYDYIEMEVAFRSISKMNVYLSDESYITPVDTQNSTNNIYGNFSRDYIAGAMRVAVVDSDGGLRMLWAPNSKYQLIDNNNTYSFNANGTAENAYYYYAEDDSGNIVPQAVSPDLYASKTFVIDSTGAKAGDTGTSPVLVSLDPDGEGKHDEATVRIRIWFEGTDREAHQALAGGNVDVKLKFIGIAKETDAEKQTAIDSIGFDGSNLSGLKEGMVYSSDGRTWSTGVPALESGASVYIKYPETATHYETDYVKFTKN